MEPSEIKDLRESLGLSVQKFAAKIGVERSNVYRWERGDTKPMGRSLRALERLSRKRPAK